MKKLIILLFIFSENIAYSEILSLRENYKNNISSYQELKQKFGNKLNDKEFLKYLGKLCHADVRSRKNNEEASLLHLKSFEYIQLAEQKNLGVKKRRDLYNQGIKLLFSIQKLYPKWKKEIVKAQLKYTKNSLQKMNLQYNK